MMSDVKQEELLLTNAQKAELDRRLDAYEKNPDDGRPAKEVMEEIRQKLCCRKRPLQ